MWEKTFSEGLLLPTSDMRRIKFVCCYLKISKPLRATPPLRRDRSTTKVLSHWHSARVCYLWTWCFGQHESCFSPAPFAKKFLPRTDRANSSTGYGLSFVIKRVRSASVRPTLQKNVHVKKFSHFFWTIFNEKRFPSLWRLCLKLISSATVCPFRMRTVLLSVPASALKVKSKWQGQVLRLRWTPIQGLGKGDLGQRSYPPRKMECERFQLFRHGQEILCCCCVSFSMFSALLWGVRKL